MRALNQGTISWLWREAFLEIMVAKAGRAASTAAS